MTTPRLDRPVRIANSSGFYGDRLSAMREQLEDPTLGYAKTFARQLEDCLGLAVERGVRIVSNAGGPNPSGLASRIAQFVDGAGIDASVAYVDGDDLRSAAA